MYFVYTIFDSWLLSLKIASAKRKLEEFRSNLLRRAPDENLNAELWYPDMNKYICVNDPNFSEEKGNFIATGFLGWEVGLGAPHISTLF